MKSNKKICFLIGNLDQSGGTERVSTIIANQLASCGYDVSFLSLYKGINPFFQLDPTIKLSSIYKKKISFKVFYIKTVFRIRDYLVKQKIDTLIVVDSISCVFTAPACFNLKINHICWEHFNYKTDLGIFFRRLGRIFAANFCNKIVTLTNEDRKFWINKHFNKSENIINIPNPCSYKENNYIANKNNKTVLSIGRLTYQKGYDLLIESWSSVIKNHPDWKLIIVGDGEDKEKLLKKIDELNLNKCITINPPTKHIQEHYKNSSIFCLSSRFEGLPMVLIEAINFGLPIVSFNCETGPKEVIIDGSNGYLVNNFDTVYFANSISKIINSTKKDYLDLCYTSKQIVHKFNIEKITKEWTSII